MPNIPLRITNTVADAAAYVPGKFGGQAIAKGTTNVFQLQLRETSAYDFVIGSDLCISFFTTGHISINFESYNNSTFEFFKLDLGVDLNDFYSDCNVYRKSQFFYFDTDSNGIFSYNSDNETLPEINDGNLHHVFIQRDYDGLDCKDTFYIDGQEVWSTQELDVLLLGRTEVANRLFIYTRDTIDELKIFHKSLSAAEVTTLLNENN